MRLIDADALDEKLDALMKRYAAQGRKQVAEDYNFVRTVLMTAPTIPNIEAVEVVRCKDCKHWLKDVAGCTDFVGRCAYANYMIGATGYCLYGERRGEDDV